MSFEEDRKSAVPEYFMAAVGNFGPFCGGGWWWWWEPGEPATSSHCMEDDDES